MAKYLSGAITSTYTLTTNPTTVTSAGTIDVNSTIVGASGILGIAGVAWTVTNLGTVESVGSNGIGINLQSGGFVTNGENGSAAGLIIGAARGVEIYLSGAASGTVANFGTIMGTAGYVSGSGTLSSYVGARGVYIGGGPNGAYGTGAVVNSGMITAAGSNSYGIEIFSSTLSGTTVTNLGTVIATGTGSRGVNTFSSNGPNVITNGRVGGAGALISGGAFGVVADGAEHVITNFGTIRATQSTGVGLLANIDETITNGGSASTAALITGPRVGIYLYEGTKTVTNFATISGGIGIYALRYGLDKYHYAITDPTTVINAGSVIGTAGTAVSFGNGDDRLVVEPGAAFFGVIDGGGGLNTLELGGSAGAALTVNYNGLTLINFQDVLFGPGGNDTLKVSNTAGTLPVTISGFGAVSDVIDLNAIGTDGTITGQSSTQVTISGSSGTVTLKLDATDGTNFHTSSDGALGTDLSIACFLRGTMILAERVEVPVEELTIGDRVRTLSGALKPIRWIGFGRDLVTSRHSLARPIVVKAGALGDGVPSRDLYLTHGHALFLDDALIAVEHLVNHRSILWDEKARVVEYYHIELDDHDVVFAAGAPAESYYDAGNRALFHNAREGFDPGAARPTYAAVLTSGECVERAWQRLFERAGETIAGETTADPDLHLVVDGVRLDPITLGDGVYAFALAAPPKRDFALRSRSAVPSHIGQSRSDHRRLGVALRQIVLHAPGMMTALGHDAPLLAAAGCHKPEAGHAWTDGELALPPELFVHLRGGFTLLIHTGQLAMRYPVVARAEAA